MFGDRKRREPNPPARTGRLVHLAEDQRGAFEHAGLPELEQQLVPLARTLANTGEHRDTRVTLDCCADQLHDQHRLADPGAAEHRGLAARDQRRQKINNLDTGVKYLARTALAVEGWCRCVDWPTLDIGRKGWTSISGVTDSVEQPPEYRFPDGCSDWLTEGAGRRATPEPSCATEGHCSHD